MDKIDYLILSELLKNARVSFLKVAKKLNVSPFTVKSRYNKMVEDGIIKRSVINIDLSKLGYQGKCFLLITNAPNTSKSITIEALKKIRNIMVVSEIIGPYDLLAIAPITDLNSIKILVGDVKKLASVQRVKIACINDTMFPINPSFAQLLSKQAADLAATI
jgi:Lrp/AsnC family transcriptional regulator for asnA, asnC and gidA